MEFLQKLPTEYIDVSHSDVFEKYFNYCRARLSHIQKSNVSEPREVFLSFYPIAKNIRFISSYMTRNILNGRASRISERSRDNEDTFWKTKLNRGDWFPWLWARGRIPSKCSNKDGWNLYFRSFNSTDLILSSEIQLNMVDPPPDDMLPFFMYLACLEYTFQPTSEYMNRIYKIQEEISWPSDEKVIAVQIRRGDTCTPDGKIAFRKIYSIQDYIDKTTVLVNKYKYKHIFISTDSSEDIEAFKKKCPKEWNIICLPFDRTNFYRSSGVAIDIEDICRQEPYRIPFTVDSAILDLYFISLCQGFVSTITTSEFSKLGWLLQIVRYKKICPYINLCNNEIDLTDILVF